MVNEEDVKLYVVDKNDGSIKLEVIQLLFIKTFLSSGLICNN